MKKVFNHSSRSILVDSRRMLVIQPNSFIELADEKAEEVILRFPKILSLSQTKVFKIALDDDDEDIIDGIGDI